MLASCTNGPFDPTLTPTSTYTASPTTCPQIDIATPGQTTSKSYLVVALFQDNPENREQTIHDVELLNKVLEKQVEPGDYIIMLRMEPQILDDATFVMQKVGSVNSTPFPSIPTPPITSTPYPTSVTTPSTTIGKTAEAIDVTATAGAVYATATYEGFLYNCTLQQWQDEYSDIQQGHETELRDKRVDFTQRVISDIEQGLQEEPVSGTFIWNGFILASKILENECGNYDGCFLLVFSDMVETYREPPGDSNINLANAEVLITMRNCPFLYADQCGEWKIFWEQYLNGKTISTTITNEDPSELVEAFLRR